MRSILGVLRLALRRGAPSRSAQDDTLTVFEVLTRNSERLPPTILDSAIREWSDYAVAVAACASGGVKNSSMLE